LGASNAYRREVVISTVPYRGGFPRQASFSAALLQLPTLLEGNKCNTTNLSLLKGIAMSSHATLSAASDDRKARLAKLRSLKRKEPEEGHAPEEAATGTADDDQAATQPDASKDVAKTYLSGRNYDPEARGPRLGFDENPALKMEGPTLEESAADVEEETRRQAAIDEQNKGIDLFQIQPKKPNWDLKRELNQKLEVLNVRTENAIARLVRARLEAKKQASGDSTLQDGDGAALEGAEIVEGIRLREREEEEEARREREEDVLDGV
jgi:coiled-coil domain-containing protein 12